MTKREDRRSRSRQISGQLVNATLPTVAAPVRHSVQLARRGGSLIRHSGFVVRHWENFCLEINPDSQNTHINH
jgi:hypothetical protein